MTFQLPIEDLLDSEWIALQRSENVLRVVVGRRGASGADGLRHIPLQELEQSATAVDSAVAEMLQQLRAGIT